MKPLRWDRALTARAIRYAAALADVLDVAWVRRFLQASEYRVHVFLLHHHMHRPLLRGAPTAHATGRHTSCAVSFSTTVGTLPRACGAVRQPRRGVCATTPGYEHVLLVCVSVRVADRCISSRPCAAQPVVRLTTAQVLQFSQLAAPQATDGTDEHESLSDLGVQLAHWQATVLLYRRIPHRPEGAALRAEAGLPTEALSRGSRPRKSPGRFVSRASLSLSPALCVCVCVCVCVWVCVSVSV
jgi:hypothetical protein